MPRPKGVALSWAKIPGLKRSKEIAKLRSRAPRSFERIQSEGRDLTEQQKIEIVDNLLNYPRFGFLEYPDDA